MPVSSEYRAYVLEQMGRVEPVSARSMFGGVSVSSAGLPFALIAGETVYLKVDDGNRADFEALGMGPFRPFADQSLTLQYYELPAELLEDPDTLRPWITAALDVARRKRRKR
ncbi:MAG TPA: TfoX/Sxy family protein [Longimicrobium sp.]|jgi:DNA transformation protein